MKTEVWYQVEYSCPGTDDWSRENNTFDTLERAAQHLRLLNTLKTLKQYKKEYEYRVVRVTATFEPVKGI